MTVTVIAIVNVTDAMKCDVDYKKLKILKFVIQNHQLNFAYMFFNKKKSFYYVHFLSSEPLPSGFSMDRSNDQERENTNIHTIKAHKFFRRHTATCMKVRCVHFKG